MTNTGGIFLLQVPLKSFIVSPPPTQKKVNLTKTVYAFTPYALCHSTFCIANKGAGNEAYAVWKGQLL